MELQIISVYLLSSPRITKVPAGNLSMDMMKRRHNKKKKYLKNEVYSLQITKICHNIRYSYSKQQLSNIDVFIINETIFKMLLQIFYIAY